MSEFSKLENAIRDVSPLSLFQEFLNEVSRCFHVAITLFFLFSQNDFFFNMKVANILLQEVAPSIW